MATYFRRQKLYPIALGLAGLYGIHRFKKQFVSEYDNIETSIFENAGKEPLVLSSFQRRIIPWEFNFRNRKGNENWEMRKVKVQGVLYGNIHLVYRERNGQKGYLVFKALKTANSNTQPVQTDDGALYKGFPIGMMVNLGWIAHEDYEKLENAEIDYVSKVEPDGSLPGLFDQVFNPYTGFAYSAEGDEFQNPNQDAVEEEVVITGYLRKGEQPNRFMGRRLFKRDQVTTYIDLIRMASFYSFDNVNSATNYYLEAAQEDNPSDPNNKNIIKAADINDPYHTINAEKQNRLKDYYSKLQVAVATITALGALLV